MKRLFLFTMMCLMGFFGSLKAQTHIDLYVGTEGSVVTTNKMPTYEYYNYSVSQQIYTAEEMQEMAGTITSIAFRQSESTSATRNFSIYLLNTDKESFTSNYDFVPMSESDLVFSGNVEYPAAIGEWMEMELSTPFEYTGGNLLVAVFDNTGSYVTGRYFDGYNTNSVYESMYSYIDSAPYDIASPQTQKQGTREYVKNVVKFGVTIQGEFKNIVVKPNPIELGARPNGAWMRPYEVEVKSRGAALSINAVETTNSYFQLSTVDMPAEVVTGNPMTINVSHGEAQGDVTARLAISYNDERGIEMVDMTAFAYDPVASDVWETADDITSYPFSVTPDMATTYDNYQLPGSTEDGKDVVYAMNFTNDVVLSAEVVGTNGKIAVYAEDFNGEEGPKANNNYGNASVYGAISEMLLPAGKYYIAASSTSEFTFNVNAVNAPAPEKASNPHPYNYQNGVSNPTLEWDFGAYTVEYQVLFGTSVPLQNVYIDWTNELDNSHPMTDLYNNTNYFWQVNVRNTNGTTYGDLWIFTTQLNEPSGMTVSDNKIYEGESTTISWNAVNRSHRGYNIYKDDEKINNELVTETSYTLDNLEYSKNGHYLSVTAVYDEGESAQSDGVIVYVTGETEIAGNIYEQDGITPIGGATIVVNGTDEFGEAVSYTYEADATGAYSGELLAGEYAATASVAGYQDKNVSFVAEYGQTAVVNFAMTEVYNPVKYIKATEINETVEVVWGMQYYSDGTETFESGDFAVNAWNNEVSEYPWAITTEAYEGEYAMKSTCEGLDNAISAIEIEYNVPADGLVGFYYKISSEQGYDKGNFYIDGVIMSTVTGEKDWTFVKIPVTAGTHTYRWEYAKDIMFASGDDAFYIDNISFYFEPEPFEGGWLYYDNGVHENSLGMGEVTPFYWGISFPASAEYAGNTITKVAVYDASPDYAGTYTANVYLGGTDAPTTLVSTKSVQLTGVADFVEIELDTPVAIDGTQSFWITFYTADILFPAAVCTHSGDANSDWYSVDGNTWVHTATYDLDYSFMVRAYLENSKGETIALQRFSDKPEFKGGVSTGTPKLSPSAERRYVGVPSNEDMAKGNRAFSSYNVYKKSIYGEEELVMEKTSDTSYIDNSWATAEAGVYQWGVSAIYEGNRDVLFSEDFEGGVLPTGWSTINRSPDWYEQAIGAATAGQWYVNNYLKAATGYDEVFNAAYGNYAAYSDGSYPYGDGFEYYLVTPQINVKPLSTMTFRFINPKWGWDICELDVRVSTSPTGPWTELWTTGHVANAPTEDGEWNEVAIDLSEYAGSSLYIAFVNKNKQQGKGTGIDNVSITAEAAESPILWSTPIDKDMTTAVTVSASTDSGDPVKGTQVTFTNLVEEGVVYTTTLGEDGTITWNDFRKGTYEFTVAKNGFISPYNNEVVEIWEASQFNAYLTEDHVAAENLYVSPTGWVMWEGQVAGNGDEFLFDFEDGTLNGFVNIDADGDGNVWMNNIEQGLSDATTQGANGSVGFAFSQSYINYVGALYPNNYLATAEKYMIGAASQLSFYACAQDETYGAEHFSVEVSTTDNASSADFTTVAEWTIGSKGNGNGDRSLRQSAWTKYTVDMSEYAGQEVYIAIRHFNCTDQFYLDIDDIALTNEGKSNRELKGYTIMLDGNVEVENYTLPYYQHENLVDGTTYTTTVIATYSMGDSDEATYTWTKVAESEYTSAVNLVAEYVNETVELSWTMPILQEPQPGDDFEVVSTFATDFETGYTGWPMIDADGDGYNWVYSTDPEDITAYSGTNCMYSESYNNTGGGALEPDNYLVLPVKIATEEGTTFSFYARAQDSRYPEEHFGVAISTTNIESEAQFTTVAEWTIEELDYTEGETPWLQYNVDLSQYAGQEIFIAIRHFECYDEFRLNVDNVEVTNASKENREGTWAYYDDGINVDGIGGPVSFSWAIKLRAADIADFGSLTKVAIFDRLATSNTFDICLGGDNAPGESVLNQTYTLTGSNDFVEFTLNQAINPAGQNVWIVFNTDDGINYPASCCNDTGDPDGRWIYLEGDGWFDVLTGAGLADTWMIRGYFENGGTGDDDDPEDNDAPVTTTEMLGAMIYRNGELLTTAPISGESYTDKKGQFGDEYCVRVVYAGEPDVTYYAMSEAICAEAGVTVECEAPKDLYAEANGSDVTLKLSYNPNPVGDWLYYDDGVNQDAIGGPASFYWGIMFPAEALAPYEGTSMTKVSLFDYSASSGDINIYYGGTTAPGEMVHSQPYSVSGTGQFVEFDLTAPLPIDPTMNVWVVFSTGQGATYPAAVCANTGDPNGRWISMDGSVWEDIVGYGLSNTWMMRAYVTNTRGELVSLSPITDYEYTTSTGEVKTAGHARATSELSHYNVYRGTSANNFELIGETTTKTYVDEDLANGTYYYQMTAVYEEYGETCESDPANAYGSDDNYVMVEVTSIDENGVKGLMIYPNPTKDNVTISVEAMTRIIVTNALGQVMMDKEVNSDNEILNMGQYEAGVYTVRIVTENGTAVERITVL